jgi:DNA replication and repair protein RecF
MSTLTQLTLRDFRNLHRADLTVPADGIAVIGENGQGKTNLLEAIYYLQLLRSVRGARDLDLIRFDAPAFHMQAHITTDRPHVVSAAFERGTKRKKLVIDGAEPSKLSDALGTLPSVMVSPRDVVLITGAPGERRRFLDVVLALTSRPYLSALQSYRASLVRRNSALRTVARTGRGEDAVAIWEPALAEYGARLLAMRTTWVAQHAETFTQLCTAIGERAPVSMSYATNVATPSSDALLAALAAKRPLDIRRGLTHSGPHRDDLPLLLDGRELRQFGSAGQHRTAACSKPQHFALTTATTPSCCSTILSPSSMFAEQRRS